MAGQSAMPYGKEFKRILENDLWLVEEHVTQARTKNGAGDHVDRKEIQILEFFLLREEYLLHHLITQEKRGCEQHSVPTRRERAECEDRGVNIPFYHSYECKQKAPDEWSGA